MIWSKRRPIAKTPDTLGLVAPPRSYRRLRLKEKDVDDGLMDEVLHPGSNTELVKELIGEGTRALADGFPATALKVGKELWAANMTASAVKLLVPAHKALGRPALAEIARVHGGCRWLRGSTDLKDLTRSKLEADRKRASKLDPDRYPF